MAQMDARRTLASAAVAIALGTALYTGAIGTMVEAARDQFGPQFARPVELDIWSQNSASKDPEPIVDPRQIAGIVGACVTPSAAIEACAAQRRTIVEAFTTALQNPVALRRTAACLTDGCGDLVGAAPANACLFWGLYLTRRASQPSANDSAVSERICFQARFGDDSRRASYVRLWNRAAGETRF